MTEADGRVVLPDTLLGRWNVVTVAGVTPIGLHGARHSSAEKRWRPECGWTA